MLVIVLAAVAATSSLVGTLAGGGPGQLVVQTTRGATVTLYGEGLYAWDTWLIGAGNRGGQDVAILVFELPILLLVLRWYRRGGAVGAAALTGVLGFFAYYYVSAVFGTAQNRLFPLYVAAASIAGFTLVRVASQLDARAVAGRLPARPGRRALSVYLFAVAAALTLAWLPGMVGTALTGDIARAVGPYTSAVTDALDLGLVVPVAVIAAAQLLRRRPQGRLLAFIMLVINVCIGVLLLAQGLAQLISGVPLTVGEIVGKMLTFAALTLVAGALLTRVAADGTRNTVPNPAIERSVG